jgi:hypothetical protein
VKPKIDTVNEDYAKQGGNVQVIAVKKEIFDRASLIVDKKIKKTQPNLIADSLVSVKENHP